MIVRSLCVLYESAVRIEVAPIPFHHQTAALGGALGHLLRSDSGHIFGWVDGWMDCRDAPQSVFSRALLVTLVAQLTFQDHPSATRWDYID